MSGTIEDLAQSVIVEFQKRLTHYRADTVSQIRKELGHVEAAAALVQQLVLDEIRIDAEPLAMAFWSKLKSAGHPLSWLPLRLSEIESWVGLLPGTFKESAEQSFKTEDIAIEISASDLQMQMEKAFVHWLYRSNGQIEAREFIAPTDVAIIDVVGTCIQRALNCTSAGIDAVDPGHAFLHLSESCRFDGAYTRGRSAAYGRLAAWKIVQQALGCSPNSNVDQIDETARKSTWFVFKCAWFYDVAWDCGVAIARPDRHIVLVAATDTD